MPILSQSLAVVPSAWFPNAPSGPGRLVALWAERFREFTLNPWDTAAGILLIEEAGGVVTDMRGGLFDIASREVLASNNLIHQELLREFAEIGAGRVEGLPKPTL